MYHPLPNQPPPGNFNRFPPPPPVQGIPPRGGAMPQYTPVPQSQPTQMMSQFPGQVPGQHMSQIPPPQQPLGLGQMPPGLPPTGQPIGGQVPPVQPTQTTFTSLSTVQPNLLTQVPTPVPQQVKKLMLIKIIKLLLNITMLKYILEF